MKTRALSLVAVFLLIFGAVSLLAQDDMAAETITVTQENLYPEGIDFDAESDQFYLTSLFYGAVYVANAAGEITQLVEDEQLISTIGVYLDVERGRVLVANSDPGVGLRTSEETQVVTAGLGVYDMESGELLNYYDLGALRPESNHFANDIAVDDEGTVYVTDSFAPIIYRVPLDGEAEILLEDEAFAGEGFALNGIVYNPDGYLVVVKSNDGLLFRVPLDDPQAFTQIETEAAYVGADGMEWDAEGRLLVIANQVAGGEANVVYHLESDDDWNSASLVTEYPLEFGATTGIVVDDTLYLLGALLENLFNPEFDGLDELFNIVPLAIGG